MATKISKIAGELADREAIRELLSRYCRGIDRMDEDEIRAVYWPDAKDEHGNFIARSVDEFLAATFPVIAEKMERTTHTVLNMLIEIDGDVAFAETYVRAFHRLWTDDGTTYDRMSSSRFLDRMARRDDEWRIEHRVVVRDWFREFPDSCLWEDGQMGRELGYGKDRPLDIGARKPEDFSYRVRERVLGHRS